MTSSTLNVLDTNVFIRAFRDFYRPQTFPGFWKALLYFHKRNRIISLQEVKAELEGHKDEIYSWAKGAPDSFFASGHQNAIKSSMDELHALLLEQGNEPREVNDFLQVADSSLVAYCKTYGATVVTQEQPAKRNERKVKIPDACKLMGVRCINVFDMLHDLGAEFHFRPPATQGK